MTRTAYADMPRTSVTGRLTAIVRGVRVAIDRARRRRATLAALRDLSDHHLRDIGLERDQIGPELEERLRRG